MVLDRDIEIDAAPSGRLSHYDFVRNYQEHAHDRSWWESRLRGAGATDDDLAFWFDQIGDAFKSGVLAPRTAPDHVRLLHWAINSHRAGLALTDAWDWYSPFLLASAWDVICYRRAGRSVKNYSDILHAQLATHVPGASGGLQRSQAMIHAWMMSRIPVERIVAIYIPAGISAEEARTMFEHRLSAGEPLSAVLEFLRVLRQRH